jgi:hypothetical protein
MVESNTVGPHYFETLGIRFLRGKGFDGAGRDHAVAVVNAAFARAFWPGEDAIGKRITRQGEGGTPIEVIGIVSTGKYASVTESPTPYIYRPMAQDCTTVRSHSPVSLTGSCLRLSNSALIAFSFAAMRLPMVFRLTVNRPVLWTAPQMCLKPKKLKVSGFPYGKNTHAVRL